MNRSASLLLNIKLFLTMEILDEKILAKQIFKKYSVNPRNWNFIISTNSIRDGFFDATVTNSDESWQLKIDSIFDLPVHSKPAYESKIPVAHCRFFSPGFCCRTYNGPSHSP